MVGPMQQTLRNLKIGADILHVIDGDLGSNNGRVIQLDLFLAVFNYKQQRTTDYVAFCLK